MPTETTKAQLFEAAYKKCSFIQPVQGKRSWDECFTIDEDLLIFWFDDLEHSTHIVHHKLIPN